jgi:hypothetical protein
MTSQDNVRRRQCLLLFSPGLRLAPAAARAKPTPTRYFSEGTTRLPEPITQLVTFLLQANKLGSTTLGAAGGTSRGICCLLCRGFVG